MTPAMVCTALAWGVIYLLSVLKLFVFWCRNGREKRKTKKCVSRVVRCNKAGKNEVGEEGAKVAGYMMLLRCQ